MPPLEYCQLCGSETGRAGRSDDSIYLDIPNNDEVGPLCEICYSRFGETMVALKKEIMEAVEQPLTSGNRLEDSTKICPKNADYCGFSNYVLTCTETTGKCPC